MNFDFDIWGRKPSKKQRKREQLRENIRKGKAGEDEAYLHYALRGYELEKTGRGSDLVARRRDLLTGRVVKTKKVEVKTGHSELSELQKRTKKKSGKYKVYRTDPLFY